MINAVRSSGHDCALTGDATMRAELAEGDRLTIAEFLAFSEQRPASS